LLLWFKILVVFEREEGVKDEKGLKIMEELCWRINYRNISDSILLKGDRKK